MIHMREREKAENELGEHVRKAVSPVETAPKQKHVRSCIIFTWDYQTSLPFWSAIKLQPVLSDQVPCFKALITIHKLLVGGPHVVLSESLREQAFLDNCARLNGQSNLGLGYGPLIRNYVAYLLAKLEFHRTHPEFTGNFDYEEYLSLKGVNDLNEGYQTISELMDLQDRLDQFQKTVFDQFRPTTHNECRIASLVPLVEESHGVYKFITSMLSAMFLCVDSADPLIPLVERYNTQFWALKQFYAECSNLRYLTSLITIPELPDRPPSFGLDEETARKNREKQRAKTPEPKKPEPKDQQNSSSSTTYEVTQIAFVPHQQPPPQMIIPAGPTPDQLALGQVRQELSQMQESLTGAIWQHQQDLSVIQQYHTKLTEAQNTIEILNARLTESESSQDALIKSLQEQVALWKSKYEGMAKLYQNLRVEHLGALSKLRDSVQSQNDSNEDVVRQLNELDLARISDQQVIERQNAEIVHLREKLGELAQQLEEQQKSDEVAANDLGDRLANELLRAAQEIEAAAAKLAALRLDEGLPAPKLASDSAILNSATIMTSAIGNLIRYATQAQQEIVAQGKGSGTPAAFYKKNSVWTSGLITAAQAVASATMMLVECADGCIRGTHSLEQLVVASNSVAAATAQLLAASRVKAIPGSKTQDLLEVAAKAVSEANRKLVSAASTSSANQASGPLSPGSMPASAQDFKVKEMDKQVHILSLEKELENARQELARLRKAGYTQSQAEAFMAQGQQ